MLKVSNSQMAEGFFVLLTVLRMLYFLLLFLPLPPSLPLSPSLPPSLPHSYRHDEFVVNENDTISSMRTEIQRNLRTLAP